MHKLITWVLLGVGALPVLSCVAPEHDSSPSQSTKRSAAEMLTIIAGPSRGERDTTRRRFEFLLPRLVERYPDIDADNQAGDMIAANFRLFREAGLELEEGGILGVANGLHSITTGFLTTHGSNVMPVGCSQIWSMYVVMRRGGISRDEARGASSIGMANFVRNVDGALESTK